jgi:hypothetical protein
MQTNAQPTKVIYQRNWCPQQLGKLLSFLYSITTITQTCIFTTVDDYCVIEY